ncbi:MAG TPA: hypothetical protein VD907_02420 [Verrucomicrobiae bacterium]|nr:hypothetical protein [Verrucomicrobiae bacterium]
MRSHLGLFIALLAMGGAVACSDVPAQTPAFADGPAVLRHLEQQLGYTPSAMNGHVTDMKAVFEKESRETKTNGKGANRRSTVSVEPAHWQVTFTFRAQNGKTCLVELDQEPNQYTTTIAVDEFGEEEVTTDGLRTTSLDNMRFETLQDKLNNPSVQQHFECFK